MKHDGGYVYVGRGARAMAKARKGLSVAAVRAANASTSSALPLMGTDIPLPFSPSPGKPQPPVYPLVQGAHGGYLEVRSSPADGSCGVGSYPCKHPGLDVAGDPGTPVVAPENGQIIQTADGNSSPWGGYGPWIVLIAGASGKFHLLAHLDPNTASLGQVGQTVTAGDQVGTVGPYYHTHWEVRDVPVPDYAHGQTGFDIISDPTIWLLTQPLGGPLGAVLVVGSAAVLLYMIHRRMKDR